MSTHHVNRKREMQNLVNQELSQQIAKNNSDAKQRMKKEKLADSVNMGALNKKLYDERRESIDNVAQQK